LKFVGELEESTIEHVTHFQIECGDLVLTSTFFDYKKMIFDEVLRNSILLDYFD